MTGGFRKQSMANMSSAAATDPMQRLTGGGHGWSVGVQYGNEMDFEFTLNSTPFFQALKQRVDSELGYPEDFSRQRITGTVRIEAEVGRDGRLVRFRSSAADDRILQTYCFAVLMNSLSRSISEGLWLSTESAIVVFDFDFRIKIPGEPSSVIVSTVHKNMISIGRENEVDPWLNEKIHEIFTHYIPPIFPLPGGFYVDFILAHQYVKNLIEGAPTESEQRRTRIESLHERLKLTLRPATKKEMN